ncbi:MAG: hypothetical protein R3Y06_11035 [Faecalibacterium sp.]
MKKRISMLILALSSILLISISAFAVDRTDESAANTSTATTVPTAELVVKAAGTLEPTAETTNFIVSLEADTANPYTRAAATYTTLADLQAALTEAGNASTSATITMDTSLTINKEDTLHIPTSITLVIPADVSLTNESTITIDGFVKNSGSIINNGTIKSNTLLYNVDTASITGTGTIEAEAAVTNNSGTTWIYASFAYAAGNASAGNTITLLKSIENSEYALTITNPVTLNLAGYTIKSTTRLQLTGSTAGTYTIQNGTLDSTADLAVYSATANPLVFTDFDILHASSYTTTSAALFLSNTAQSITISDCNFTSTHFGTYITNTVTADVNIESSAITGTSYGLIAYCSSNVTLRDTTITGTSGQGINTSYAIRLKIESGTTVTGASTTNGITIIAQTSGSPIVTVEDGATITAKYAILIGGAYTNGVAAESVPADTIPQLIVNGGTIGDENSTNAIIGNGSQDFTYVEINGGTMTGGQNMGISYPQTGDLLITGGTIIGPTGIQYGGNGNITITGGTIIATDEAIDLYKDAADGDGAVLRAGAALLLASRGAGYQDSGRTIKATITGGVLESYHNEPLMVIRMGKDSLWVFNDEDSTTYPSYLEYLNISGGTFLGADQMSVEPIAESEEVVTITGGTFEVAPSTAWLGDGYYVSSKTDSNGNYLVTNAAIATPVPTTSVTVTVTSTEATPTPTASTSVTAVTTATPSPTPTTTDIIYVSTSVTASITQDQATATITDDTVQDAIASALARMEAEQALAANIMLDVQTDDASDISFTLSSESIHSLIEAEINAITLASSGVQLTIDSSTLDAMKQMLSGEISIVATKITDEAFHADTQTTIDAHPIFEFNIVDAQGNRLTNFTGGSITVSIPYTLQESEVAENIVVYYVDETGALAEAMNTSYDTQSEMAIFSTTHFSTFALVHLVADATDTDIATDMPDARSEDAVATTQVINNLNIPFLLIAFLVGLFLLGSILFFVFKKRNVED